MPGNSHYTVKRGIRSKLLFVFLQDELPDMSIIYGVTVQFASKRLVVLEVNPMWTAETWDIRG